MDYNNPYKKFAEYLQRISDVKQDKCWSCGKTPDKFREEYLEYLKRPDKGFDGIELEDLVIMTYKTKKPICAGCYFAIKQNASLVKEILDRPIEDIW